MTAEQFRAAMDRAGYEPRDLARMLDVGKSSIYRWRRGDRPVPVLVEVAILTLAMEWDKARGALIRMSSR